MLRSTLNANVAANGGGIYSELFMHNNAALTLTNSTLSGNTASRDGGGLYAQGGQIKLLNVTLAGNQVVVPLNIFYNGLGGGVYITGSAVMAVQNTLLGDNVHRYSINFPEPDDCHTSSNSLLSLGNNLIETTSGCVIGGSTLGNLTGQAPLLGPLQNNGGTTDTRQPWAGSPAIDHGDNTACPPNDQRGWHRPIGVSCDIGAVEVGPYVYLPSIQR